MEERMRKGENNSLTFTEKINRQLFGEPRDLRDPRIFHKISLVALLAWIGLGADGLSSSSYGPEEAFRTLGEHTYLAVFLAIATALTVSVISYAYSNIIEHFPHGGGGYIVATHMFGPKAGVLSGSGFDYRLCFDHFGVDSCLRRCSITAFCRWNFISINLLTAAVFILVMMLMNIRGVKESILVLAPIFITFVITHILLLGYGIFSHIGQFKPVAENFHADFSKDLSTIGGMGMFLIFLRAYSFGAGTYTGIEAVSNGLQIMREPRVQTGKRTMLYMAVSLAITAGGLLVCYLLIGFKPLAGKTFNAILADNLFGGWKFGYWIALITILSEGALLLVASQTGFIGAPRVMANMATDSWLPHRFASFSERLTLRNGVVMIESGSSCHSVLHSRFNGGPCNYVFNQCLYHLLPVAIRNGLVFY